MSWSQNVGDGSYNYYKAGVNLSHFITIRNPRGARNGCTLVNNLRIGGIDMTRVSKYEWPFKEKEEAE